MQIILISLYFLVFTIFIIISHFLNKKENIIQNKLQGELGNTSISSPQNIHIEKFLDYYCELINPPGYGVMIAGPWGSGKTWFAEKYQEKLKTHNKKTIYVSLYGLSKTNEIDEAIFQALHPILSHKSARLAGKILKSAIKAKINIDINGKNNNLETTAGIPNINLPDYLCHTEKHIFIYDDLERCDIPLNQLFGYVNHFIEHYDMKCIFIANEEILKKNGDSADKPYKEIRDKIIGKRFGFTSDIDTFILNIANSPPCANCKILLNRNIESIKSIYRQAGFENLRPLKQTLFDFDRIFLEIIQNKDFDAEIEDHILQSHLFLSLEIISGNLDFKDIIGINSNSMLRFIKREIKNDGRTAVEKHIDSILLKYKGWGCTEIFPSEEFWKLFFEMGTLDREIAEKSISNSKYFHTENTPYWQRLWHFMDLEDNDFAETLSIVQTEYYTRKYKEISIVLHVFGLQLCLCCRGLLEVEKNHILQDAKNYIDLLEEQELLPKEALSEDSHAYGLGYFEFTTPEFEDIYQYAVDAQKRQHEKSLPEKAANLIHEMHQDFALFSRRLWLNNSRDKIYYDIPILSKIDAEVFFNELGKLNNKQKRDFGDLLPQRYTHAQHLPALSDEEQWLKDVNILLKNEAEIRKGKISGYIYTILSNKFEESILAFSNKQNL